MSTTAIDIGGSGIRVARVSDHGVVETMQRLELAGNADLAATEEQLRTAVEAVRGPSSVIGVSIPSVIRGGVAHEVFNRPALEGVHIATWMHALTELPSYAYMDIDAAAHAEATVGVARSTERLLCITLGTGASAALTVGGSSNVPGGERLFNAGHLHVGGTRPCTCGAVGCLESVCSGVALHRVATELGMSGVAELVEAGWAGVSEATAAFDEAGVALARLIAILHLLLVPDRTVLTGGLSRSRDLLTVPMHRELGRVCGDRLDPPVGEVVLSDMPLDAAVVGAGLLAARDHGGLDRDGDMP